VKIIGVLTPIIASIFIAGCSIPLHENAANPYRTPASLPAWSGRLALRVDDPQTPSFSSNFELKGSSLTGELKLLTPLGSTLAQLQWSPAQARLQAPGRDTRFASLQDMLAAVVGTPLPVRAMFDWLEGIDTATDGWHVDLSQYTHGKITAQRAQPPAELRLVLEP
jgi:outer membrane lipoprotein LolB